MIRKYYFINKFETNNIDKQDKQTIVIYRKYNSNIFDKELILKIKKYCKNRGIEFYLSNNIKLAIKLNLDGAYIPWAERINHLTMDAEYVHGVSATAARYAALGHKVLVVSDRVHFLKSCAKLCGDKAVSITGDMDFAERERTMQMIKDITAKAELNKIYSGKVMKIMEFGAFVNFLGKQDGLVHISELADKRVAKVTDVVKEGDEVKVKVIGFDRGKVKLSMKQAID